MERAKTEGWNPITHVMIEASLNEFMDEQAIVIYLRNVSHSVEVQKIFQKAFEEEVIEEAEDAIVEALADKINESQEGPTIGNKNTDKKLISVNKLHSGTANVDDVMFLLSEDDSSNLNKSHKRNDSNSLNKSIKHNLSLV